ncbi:hypothetical protein PKHYL_02340 [Psychrobacter sp. KH172YL61]|uniref:type II restriction enzyme n=1 Tax=Psychrobacter sp. KH172YL61 TaxID=2517899 RepID=UPI0010B6F698|nr:hypothetical protein [Psychrobacter sp. KH172YL61]BBI66043.1 hypothetical protein PKHYL_02340 [Psychrobacter sp. KH172YL61]
MNKSKNDLAWERLFEEDSLLDKIDAEGEFVVHSKRINDFRQARLMTKFDARKDLPEIFKRISYLFCQLVEEAIKLEDLICSITLKITILLKDQM